MDIKQELRYTIEKHKNDRLQTFQTNISLMAETCLREIESLEEDIKGLTDRLEISPQGDDKIDELEDVIRKMASRIKQFEERYFED